MHFEQAGDAPRALEYLVMDGRYALERAAVREAFTALDRAAALLAAVDDTAGGAASSSRAGRGAGPARPGRPDVP